MLLHLFHNQGKGQPIGGDLSYAQKVLSIDRNNLIAYWPLWEANGINADNYESTLERDGAYNSDVSSWPVATGIGDGNTVPTFDGINDAVNIYNASYISAFSGIAGTVLLWGKVVNAANWESGLTEHLFSTSSADQSTGAVLLYKFPSGGDRGIDCHYRAGGVWKNVYVLTTSTDWFHLAITWDAGVDQVKVYFNGTQYGSTQTGLGVWGGEPHSELTVVGAAGSGGSFGSPWNGYEGQVAVWTKALTANQIVYLAQV